MDSSAKKRKAKSCPDITEDQGVDVGSGGMSKKKSKASNDESRENEQADWPEYFHSVS